MDVLLPGHLDWKTFKTAQSFEVQASSSSRLKLKGRWITAVPKDTLPRNRKNQVVACPDLGTISA